MQTYRSNQACPKTGFWSNVETNEVLYIKKGEIFQPIYIATKDSSGSVSLTPSDEVAHYQFIGETKILIKDASRVDSNLKWDQLGDSDKRQAEFIYREHGKYCTEISRTASDTTWNWFFLLNAGGLIGTITLLGFNLNSQSYVELCIFLIIFFTLGITSIIISVLIEKKRFELHGQAHDVSFTELTLGKIGLDDFYKKLDQNTKINGWVPNLFEKLSIIFFSIALIVGVSFFIFNKPSVPVKNSINEICDSCIRPSSIQNFNYSTCNK